MLLLLVLSFLGGAASILSDYYGRMCANHFCIESREGDDLSGIRVYERNGRMLSIQGRFADCWTQVYGKTDRGTPNTLELRWKDGERIIAALGSVLVNIRSLLVDTVERQHLFGAAAGQEFLSYPPERDYVLKGICGVYDATGLRAIAFKWGEFKENSTTQSC